jgi:hypothetical protein
MEPSCQPSARRSVDRRDVAGELRTVDGYPIHSGSRQRRSRLQRLKLALSRNETLQTTGLHELVLLLGELGQPIRGRPQILTEHRPTNDYLMLDRLHNQLVLANA